MPPVEFDEVFRDSFPVVVRTVYLVTGDWEVARDLTQDAFVQLLRHWRKLAHYDNPGAWTRRVAIRLAVRDQRRGVAVRASARPEPPDLDGALDLREAILTLPRAQRAAVSLHYLAGLPVADVAATLGCTASTARTHLQRARERLATLLREEVEDEAR